MDSAIILNHVKEMTRSGMVVPFVLLLLLAMIILPLPPFLLDLLFTFNISLSMIILLVCIYSSRPLEFATFPSVLLIATLLRLGLNVASTRVVLINGHTGADAAGDVVEAFGSVVIGGNYAVGIVVFMVLVIINFVVVTKGAGRVSEVSARFTLDAMPGKQMAIDADLNAGLITSEEAKERRTDIAQEADFYGSMDGASKFVRGDAIAGILILFVNLIGGIAIGMLQNDMTFGGALQNYALLTVGDGLVAQIPSLLLSTATAIVVTRVSSSADMGQQVVLQVFSSNRILLITGGIMIGIGLIPGMPHIAFVGLGAGIIGIIYYRSRKSPEVIKSDEELEEEALEKIESNTELKELTWDDVNGVDVIGLEVGYRLIPMVDSNQGGELMSRIKGVRKKLSQELGFLIPTVHIRDNLDLPPNVYRITVKGITMGEAEVHLDKELAINPGQVFGELEGIQTKDPAFGLDAVWISPDLHEKAQTQAYTVVDPSTVVATHLSDLLQRHAAELLGYDEVQKLLDKLSENSPKLVEDLVPNKLPLGSVVSILQNLLLEQIPVRDIRTILEALAEFASKTQDCDQLTMLVRVALRRVVVQEIVGMETEIPVMTLDPELEQILQQSLQTAEGDTVGFEPGLAERLQTSIAEVSQQQELVSQPSVLLLPAAIRHILARFLRSSLPHLWVLSYQEIPEDKQIKIISTIGQSE